MKNLFVMHTQYNLIIAIAIINQEYKDDENDLLLFTDFSLDKNVRLALENYFSHICILEGTFPAINKTWRFKVKKIPSAIKTIDNFIKNTKYDRLFWVCDDAIPEIWILKQLHDRNQNLYIGWIEDGAFPYFDNEAVGTGLNRNTFTRTLRKVVGRIAVGKYYSYEGTTIASNNWTNEYWVSFPNAVRSKFENKNLRKIEFECFQYGIGILYSKISYSISDHSFVFLLDKIDVYKAPYKVEEILEQIIKKCEKMNIDVYYKYHPREESEFGILTNKYEIPRNIGVEGILANNTGKKLCVIGIKSTALQSSKMCAFETVSIAKIVGENSGEVQKFYEKIGVTILDDVYEMDMIIKKLNR